MAVDVERKVGAAGLGGALAIIFIWVLGFFISDIPAEVGAAFAAVFSFIAGYFTPA